MCQVISLYLLLSLLYLNWELSPWILQLYKHFNFFFFYIQWYCTKDGNFFFHLFLTKSNVHNFREWKPKKKESLFYWTDYSKCYFLLNFNNFCFGEWKHFNLYPEWSISFDVFIWIPDQLHCQILATEPKKWLMLSNAWYLQCFWQGLVFTSWKII